MRTSMKKNLVFIQLLIFCVCAAAAVEAGQRDPFVSILDQREQAKRSDEDRMEISEVKVSGIIWNEARPIAILNNGDLVTVEDTWKQFRVEGIDKESITLSEAGKSYRLYVNNPSQTEQSNSSKKS